LTPLQGPPADPLKPYQGRFTCHDRIPSKGCDQDDIFGELATLAAEENAR
jgi:hypothetical protein